MRLPPGSWTLLAVLGVGAILLAVELPAVSAIWLGAWLALLGWRTTRHRESLARWLDAIDSDTPPTAASTRAALRIWSRPRQVPVAASLDNDSGQATRFRVAGEPPEAAAPADSPSGAAATTARSPAASPAADGLPEGQGPWRQIFERLDRQFRDAGMEREAADAEIDRLRAVVDLLPDALVVLDQNHRVQWLNRAATDLLGPVITHRPVEHFIREPEFLRYLESSDFKGPVTLPLANRPGKMFTMRLVPTPDRWNLLILRDVTPQHRVDAMRRDFVANVSHEIRTPLTVISGFIDTLIDIELPRDQQLQHLRLARKQSATMERLLTDLLTLSSLESSATTENHPFPLRPLLEAQIADARALSGGKHLIQLEARREVQLTGAAGEIETAVRNLLTNAIRYTPAGGSIIVTLEAEPTARTFAIHVADTGIGVAREHLPRLSERFYRVDRGRSRDTGGTGLGLAIVKHVAQRHDAQLEIDSTPGRGSTFSIIIPSSRAAIGGLDDAFRSTDLPVSGRR